MGRMKEIDLEIKVIESSTEVKCQKCGCKWDDCNKFQVIIDESVIVKCNNCCTEFPFSTVVAQVMPQSA